MYSYSIRNTGYKLLRITLVILLVKLLAFSKERPALGSILQNELKEKKN